METRRVILFNAEEIHLIFSIASIMRRKGEATIIPVVPSQINDWRKSEMDIQDTIFKYWEKRGLEINRIDTGPEPEFYILGVYPKTAEDISCLYRFAEENGDRIKIWADNHMWPDFEHLKSMRKICKNFKVSPVKSVLEIIQNSGYRFPRYWEASDHALSDAEAEVWEDDLAYRIISAISVSLSIERNTMEQVFLPSIYIAIGELISGKENYEIDRLLANFGDMISFTVKAKDKIEIFEGSEKYGRPIAYADLGDVEEYADITGIMEEAIGRFPWLCAIKANGKLYTASAKIDLGDIMSLYPEMDNDTIMKVLAAEVKTYGKHPKFKFD